MTDLTKSNNNKLTGLMPKNRARASGAGPSQQSL
jgi:hypothetical protein